MPPKRAAASRGSGRSASTKSRAPPAKRARASPKSAKRGKKPTDNSVASRPGSGKYATNAACERFVFQFLPYLPDRIQVEQVCKSWRHSSQVEVPIKDLDFSKVSARRLNKSHFKMLVARAAGNLERIALLSISLDDLCLEALRENTELKHMRALRLTRKDLFGVLRNCQQLETLDVAESQSVSFTRWETQSPQLHAVSLHACQSMSIAGASSMIVHCGSILKTLVLTGAQNVDSSILPVLGHQATALEELMLSYAKEIRLRDLESFTRSVAPTLRLLDLSSSIGVSGFPNAAVLEELQVLILDNTEISDDGLRAIAAAVPHLKYLSLQECRIITDDGLTAFSAMEDGCVGLQLLDLRGTLVTDVGITAVTSGFPHLRMLRLDSCRNVSRQLRLEHGTRTRSLLGQASRTWYEKLAVTRISTPEHTAVAIANDSSSSDSDAESDDSYEP